MSLREPLLNIISEKHTFSDARKTTKGEGYVEAGIMLEFCKNIKHVTEHLLARATKKLGYIFARDVEVVEATFPYASA